MMPAANGRGQDLDAVRAAVASAAHALAAAGLVAGTSGNVSARAGELIAITPTGAELGRVTPDEITVVDEAGTVVEGKLAPTSEISLHLGAYTRYGAGAVVHTHSPCATALSTVLDELPCVHYEMLGLGGTVRVAPYRTFGTPELAAVTLDALEGRMAALMSNHGAIVLGNDIEHGVRQAQLLEWACMLYWRAAAIGTPRTLDEQQRMAVVEVAVARRYGTTRDVDR
jgi:L-fuculose-phosphate aldolase